MELDAIISAALAAIVSVSGDRYFPGIVNFAVSAVRVVFGLKKD